MNKYALIVAGGSGVRMGTALPKQFLPLRNRTVLWHTLTAFQQAFMDIQTVLVLPEGHLQTGRAIAASTVNPGNIVVVQGGTSRFYSVQNGLQHVPSDSIVFIHDGVRCLVTPALIQLCYEAALVHGNAIPAVAATDTIRMVTENGNALVDRSKVRIIQTPQTFYSSTVKAAYQQPFDVAFTDEASVVEKWGESIHLVEGEATNVKITRQIDLAVAERILEERERGER